MTQIPYSWIEKLFENMTMLYGARMDKMWSNLNRQDVITFWHSKLDGYSHEEFVRGVKAVEKQEYPPSLPQFLNLCRPPVDYTKAYYEAVKGLQERRLGRKGEWSHPAIFWAASGMAFDLLNMSYTQCRSRFERALDKELEQTVWQEIPEAFPTLPEPVMDREKAKTEAEKMLERVNAIESTPKTFEIGNRQWISNNFKRMLEGWKPLPAVRKCIFDGAKAAGIPVPSKLSTGGAK